MKKKNIIIISLVLIIVLAVSGALYDKFSLSVENNPGQVGAADNEKDSEDSKESLAPDFTVYDIEGNPVKLSDFHGTPLVLNFWASWCGPCKSEMADFNELYEKYDGQVAFMMVNLTDGNRETVEIASSFIKEEGYTFPVFYDTDGDAQTTYRAYTIPTTYLIDSEGIMQAYASGALDGATLNDAITTYILD